VASDILLSLLIVVWDKAGVPINSIITKESIPKQRFALVDILFMFV
jgi:hypothetical protein